MAETKFHGFEHHVLPQSDGDGGVMDGITDTWPTNPIRDGVAGCLPRRRASCWSRVKEQPPILPIG